MLVRLASILILLLIVGNAFAQPLEPYTPPSAPPPIDPIGLLFRLVGLTAITLVVCGGGIIAARRFGRTKIGNANNAGRLVHDGTLALDRRASLHAIRVDGQRVVVAVDATGLRSLTLISEPFEAVLAEELADGNTAARPTITE